MFQPLNFHYQKPSYLKKPPASYYTDQSWLFEHLFAQPYSEFQPLDLFLKDTTTELIQTFKPKVINYNFDVPPNVDFIYELSTFISSKNSLVYCWFDVWTLLLYKLNLPVISPFSYECISNEDVQTVLSSIEKLGLNDELKNSILWFTSEFNSRFNSDTEPELPTPKPKKKSNLSIIQSLS